MKNIALLFYLFVIIESCLADTINTLSGHISSTNTQSFVSISPFHVQPSRKLLYHSKTSDLTFDADNDTVPDIYEIDNDNDGLTDEAELFTHMTFHNDSDSDDDELLDGAEIQTTNTLPNNPDTDTDEMPDGWEVIHFLDPLANDADIDTDGDGFSNFQEYTNQTNPQLYILPLKAGWNLVSLARIPEENTVAKIFGGSIKGNVWYWDENQFKTATHIDPLKGYWIYTNSEQDVLLLSGVDDLNQLLNALTDVIPLFTETGTIAEEVEIELIRRRRQVIEPR